MGDRIQHTADAVYTAMIEQKLIEGIGEARSELYLVSLSPLEFTDFLTKKYLFSHEETQRFFLRLTAIAVIIPPW